MKIIISGALGRMGRAVCRTAEANGIEIAAGVDLNAASSDLSYPVYKDFAGVKESADVVIDFSSPLNLDNLLAYTAKTGIPAVLCATGYTPEQLKRIDAASESSAIFRSANMSVGVNLLIDLCKKAAKTLPSFDVEIVEMHHNQKVDAPSGTALMLADAVKEVAPDKFYVYGREGKVGKRNEKEIGIHALRGGNVVGEHEVIFAGPNETVTLSHSAASREVFADGAVKAAMFMAGRKSGFYTMDDLIKEL